MEMVSKNRIILNQIQPDIAEFQRNSKQVRIVSQSHTCRLWLDIYGTVVVKLQKWQRKLVEIPCEYTLP